MNKYENKMEAAKKKLLVLLTAIDLSLGGSSTDSSTDSSPYTGKDRTNKIKYT